ncbi:4Fe-4S ferredoxin-type domain-containing protein [Entamoeba marina]
MDTRLTELRNSCYAAVIKCFFDGNFVQDIDNLPTKMIDESNWKPSSRAVHKENMMMKKPLSHYAQLALDRTEITEPVFGISGECCNECNISGFTVTNMCEGCTARPCEFNCPKKCISFNENGQAVIDKSKCISCGKCAKNCPYGAIVQKPIPCMKACPVDAIINHPDGTKTIDHNKCINCGGCMRACPFAAILPKSQIIDVLKLFETKNVVACPAPAIAAHFGKYDVPTVATALVKAGFGEVEEVAYGADLCSIEEAKEFKERIYDQKKDFMTTSCCPAYINCINKHIPDLKENVSHTPTPMNFTSRIVKERNPENITVFIGPCNAKKMGNFTRYGLEPYQFQNIAHKEGRIFPVSGGVASAVASLLPKDVPDGFIKPVIIDGLSKQNFLRLRNFKKKPQGNIVEVMVCEGGCAYGPGCPGLKQPASTAKVKIAVDKGIAHPMGKWVGVPNQKVQPIKVV